MDKDYNDKIFNDIQQLAAKVVPPGSMALLYGSRARGTSHKGSDWDVLLIINKDKLKQEDYDGISYPFVLLGCDLGAEINPMMYTMSEWQSYTNTPFYENVCKDAIKIYE